MKVKAKWILGLSPLLVIAAAARSQEPGPEGQVVIMGGGPGMGPGPGAFGERMELLGFGGMHSGKVVTGAPFSAVAVNESKQTLADGTTITHKSQANLYRDAEGRFRKEVTPPAIGPLSSNGKPRSFILIHDPVAGASYILNPEGKIAHKLTAKNGGPEGKGHGEAGIHENFAADGEGNVHYQKFAAGAGPGSEANLKKESLGTQTINGIAAQGTRYTRTIPVGEIGNDKALTIVKEEWYSPDLQIVVQSKRTDPMMGEMTYTVTNIQRAAPSTNLFAVPSDYTVKEGPAKMMRKDFHHGDVF